MSDWFALVDGAQDPGLYPLVQRCADHACLFSGTIAPSMAPACPYLVRLDEREPLLPTWREHGAGRNWGMLVESDLPLEALRRHLRHFTTAKLPDGQVVLFRFYDPRVFVSYLTSAPAEQAASWFEGVRQFMADADGVQHAFRWRHGRLFDFDQPVELAA